MIYTYIVHDSKKRSLFALSLILCEKIPRSNPGFTYNKEYTLHCKVYNI